MDLNLDTFGEMMDEFLEQKHIQVLLDIPEGTNDVIIKDNVGIGPVVHFYIILQGLCATFREFRHILDPALEENFIDETLQDVKKEILSKEE